MATFAVACVASPFRPPHSYPRIPAIRRSLQTQANVLESLQFSPNYLSLHAQTHVSIEPSQSPPITEEPPPGSLEVGKSLEDVKVLDLEGNSILVTELWKDRRVVVGFTRHFGCILCRKRADLLASRKAEMEAANTSLIIIGPGSVEQAQAFAEATLFPGEVYADPSHLTHDALKFVSGIGSTISPKTGMRLLTAFFQGYRQDWGLSFRKDTVSKGGWQQGGVLVAGPGKDCILYLFKDVQAGDEPNMDDIVRVCSTA